MSDLRRLTRSAPIHSSGIVHFGPGAFFRAFNAVFTDTVLSTSGGNWGITAVSLQSDRTARALMPQGCAYTAVSKEAAGDRLQIIEAVSTVLVAPVDPEAVLRILTDPHIKVVSLTITEKGYCHNPATGDLRLEALDIQSDLANPAQPKTAPGYLVEALARRRAAGARPFTVLSCDNLPDNGATARRIVVQLAQARDRGLAAWISEQGRFPATMVDRITPATTREDIDRLAAQAGYLDLACVQHEPFCQWVIEDDFVDGARPDWNVAGAQFVASVSAHEMMKLRCLNGTHSTLAYLGYLAGHETIAQTVAEPVFDALCREMWSREILPTIAAPEGEDLAAYTEALLERYRNPAIRHRTWQIAMDGSQKLPQRILGTIADNLASGRVPQGLCLAVAGWMRYVSGVDAAGNPIDVRDPLAADLRSASDGATGSAEKVAALLAFDAIFPAKLAADSRFREAVTRAYAAIRKDGTRQAVATLVSPAP